MGIKQKWGIKEIIKLHEDTRNAGRGMTVKSEEE